MIRVLVVDDSATARALIVEILRSDPDLQVVGEAKDGLEAVVLTQKLRPDVVTMDNRMPRMDGLAATKEIMINAPTPIIIVTASMESRDVDLAMYALRAGAVAILLKPPGPDSSLFQEAAQKLIATVKAMAQVKVVRHWRAAARGKGPLPPASRTGAWEQVIAIVASTGGPAALQMLFSGLPGDFPGPILVVQHITSGFTQGLAAWLDSVCDLRVKVAAQGEILAPHTVYLAPDERHLGVSSNVIALSSALPVGGFRPSGTFLFESVAQTFGSAAVAIVLTGMGEDGVEGLRVIRRSGGLVIAQNEESSVVFGMPGAAIAAGLADFVLPLEAIPARLMEDNGNE